MRRFFARATDHRSRRQRWMDRTAGIVVGVVLGLGVLVYFVFVHSEGTIDAPKIGGAKKSVGESASSHPEESASPKPGSESRENAKPPPRSGRKSRPVPVVKVIGGAPPTGGGPKQLNFKVDEKVRFEVETDEPFSFEIRGLGIQESIESSSIVSFKAKQAGQFPVIATSTLIGVADLLIKRR